MSDINDLFKDVVENMDAKDACDCIVRLRTGFWSSKQGIHMKKDIIFMRKLSGGSNYVKEDVDIMGAEDVINGIVNLDGCGDGIYEIVPCNIQYDLETGYQDGYEYKLIPFSLSENKT